MWIMVCVVISFVSYWIGKFMGVKEAFDKLEKEGKIISKDKLKDLIK
jgi:hypothetical protein